MTSGTGTAEDRRSENQIESMALLSQRSVSSQRNAAPADPAGHGPGMIPIRYLISMSGMVATTVPLRLDRQGRLDSCQAPDIECLH